MRKEGLHAFSSYTIILAIFISASISFPAIASGSRRHPCSDQFIKLTQERNLTHCKKLHTLDSALGWNYFKTNNSGTHIDILFAATIDEEHEVVWLAWGVNPGKTAEMVGTKAIIGIRQPNMSTIVNPYDVTKETKRGCKFLPNPDIGFQFTDMLMDYDNQTHIYTLSAKMILPSYYNISRLNHVWQVGYQANGSQPYIHPHTLEHINSAETINLTSGHDFSMYSSRERLRIVHGTLSFIGWGTILPIGIITARYFRAYPIKLPNMLGYKLHVLFQIIGYTIGTIGWAIGLFLGHLSRAYIFQVHRTYGIVIFTCATAQVISYRLRPDDEDDYRKYWNMYHHFLGYAIIVLIVINIFHGIGILNAGQGWKWTYVGLLGLLGLVVLSFEIYTWYKFKAESNKKKPDGKPKNAIGTTDSPAHQELDKSASKAQNVLQTKQP